MSEITEQIEIHAFYEFKELSSVGDLLSIKDELKSAMIRRSVKGTIIIADEGYNAMVCGKGAELRSFITDLENIFQTTISPKVSYTDQPPFRKTDVRIKKEIVTLRKEVDMSLAAGTHVSPEDWNSLISDPETFVLDTRNDYEFRTGTFIGATNPGIASFSELPDFIEEHLDPARHKRIAMFCTGGIRCEKFAPYMRAKGFDDVRQLEGGILKYLEIVPREESLWSGECFVFDERITVDADLRKGAVPDLSQRRKTRSLSGKESE